MRIYLSFLLLSNLVILIDCCKPAPITDKKKYPSAELLIPGISEWEAMSASTDVGPFISSVLSVLVSSIPGGQLVNPLLSGFSTINSLLNKAESGYAKFIDKKIGVAAIADVRAKLATIEQRMKEVKHYMDKNENYDIPLYITLDKCGEILQKFSYNWGPLYKSGNSLVSSPSLLSFTKLYAGVAIIALKLWPEKREHVITEMELLRTTLQQYQNGFVASRLSFLYFNNNIYSVDGYQTDCADYFYTVTKCDSCHKVDCDAENWASFVPLGHPWTIQYSPELFDGYKKELTTKYTEYFKAPLTKLDELVAQLEKH